MSVPVQTPSKEYIANGTTTAFPLEFNCDKAEYLIVTLNGEEAPVGSWTLANDTVTFNVAPLNGVVVNLERNTPFQRTTNYQLYDNSFRPSAVNKDFDLIWWKLQELGYRDQVIWLALVKEISDRIAGDDNLQNQINTIDEWLGNLQENVDQNTNDIEQLVNDLSKEIADRIKGDQILKDMFLSMIDEAINEGTINALAVTHVDSLEGLNAISNVWDGRTIYVKDLGNYRYDALTTSWVKAYQDADNVKDGIETQKLINNKTIQKVESISDLINLNPRDNGQVVQVLSFHEGKDRGGDYFKWSATLSKSLHDGGYFIDPLIAIPPLATFNTYYLPRNSGNGIWVRLNNKQDIYAEAYGLVKMSDDPTAVWSCAAIQQAIYKASVKSNTDYYPKTARVMPGRYYTTNPIVLTQIDGFSARLPALIGGNGNSIYDVELIKTTQNTVGPGYYGGDVDAVIFTSAKTSGSQYVYGEKTSGFTLSRTDLDVGYGYFAQNSVQGYRGNIQAVGHAQNIYTNDCWMTRLGFIRSYQGKKGIAIRGGTSNFGGPLYVDMAKEHGYDFYGLSYSDLNCACDGVGAGLANGGIAYDLSFCKSVSGTFAVERHKGIEFYLNNTDGGSAKGRSYHSTAVPAPTYKVWVQAGSTFSFTGYNWKESLVNLSTADKANYRLTNKVKYQGTSSVEYSGCEFSPEFARDGFAGQLDSKFAAKVVDAAYSDNAGIIAHTIAISNTVFKRLCWLGQSSAVELLSANAVNPTYSDRYYSNAFVLTEGTPNTIANPKPNRIAKTAISTDSANPTILWYLYQSGAITNSHLRGYIDADGWLCVQHSVAGNGLEYRFLVVV
ncbi:hypothetical protein [Acinetobacter baumannii]|uniref:hypothetical protein n=1 Tax=Acinetobacter baumannii TaxID=470 RepID=UPI0003DF2AE2|nr:hypothetical protein [Acinetobacter baumannii]ETQ80318.1 hypothetical protein P668_0875 [Acinetobacter baumannii UH5207]KCX73327.1 hypothetical protein J560_3213 [Acinetobacter baumannii 855125]